MHLAVKPGCNERRKFVRILPLFTLMPGDMRDFRAAKPLPGIRPDGIARDIFSFEYRYDVDRIAPSDWWYVTWGCAPILHPNVPPITALFTDRKRSCKAMSTRHHVLDRKRGALRRNKIERHLRTRKGDAPAIITIRAPRAYPKLAKTSAGQRNNKFRAGRSLYRGS